MENLIFVLCLVMGIAFTAFLAVLVGVLVYFVEHLRREDRPVDQAESQELPEEREARRLAAEAQRRYEQGFVNLMSYDGSPRRKEEREQQ